MVEDLKTIYKGKATLIKNKQYYSAKEYIEPFVNRLSKYTNKFVCEVKVADQLSSDGMEINTVYNRALIMAIFPDQYDITVNKTSYHRVVCMAIGLDIKNPICKFYTGVINQNYIFYAFGPDCMNIQKVEPETALDYSNIQTIINNGLNDNCEAMLKQLVDLEIPKNTLINEMGKWVDFTLTKEYINDSGKVKLSSALAVDAYKNIALNKDSDFYVTDDFCSYLTVYNALASPIVSDEKDLTNKYEKSKLINQLLGL